MYVQVSFPGGEGVENYKWFIYINFESNKTQRQYTFIPDVFIDKYICSLSSEGHHFLLWYSIIKFFP